MSRPNDTTCLVRAANPDDLAATLAIYNHYVEHSVVSFDLEPALLQPWRDKWNLGSASPRYRKFVALCGDVVVGYAASIRMRDKPAWDTSVETSIYVHPEHHGRGIGGQLYRALFHALAEADLHRAYASITLPNDASIGLHQRFNFHRVGTMTQAGRKFDRYWDVLWMEKAIR